MAPEEGGDKKESTTLKPGLYLYGPPGVVLAHPPVFWMENLRSKEYVTSYGCPKPRTLDF